MKKLALAIAAVLSALTTQAKAETKAIFQGDFKSYIQLQDGDQADRDGSMIFNAMVDTASPQSTSTDLIRSFKTSDLYFSVICAQSIEDRFSQCSFTVYNGHGGAIDSEHGNISYSADDKLAHEAFAAFGNKDFSFTSLDGKVTLSSTAAHFEIRYSR